MDDIILIDKPVGITSFDVIRILRKQMGIKKMGHAGTLDPLASGLMIIGIQKGTKKLNEYLKLPKVYIADIIIGESRDTGDAEGEVIEEKEVAELPDVEMVLSQMEGMLQLPVPKYSAIKQGGEALYKKARRGEDVAVPIKPMEVRSAELLSCEIRDGKGYVQVRFDVGSGTYIRSLAEELGRRLGYPSTLGGLRRLSIGNFSVEGAVYLEV